MKNYPLLGLTLLLIITVGCEVFIKADQDKAVTNDAAQDSTLLDQDSSKLVKMDTVPTLDIVMYNKLMASLSDGDTTNLWPPKTPYPNLGAILPYHRIIAFYGNLYSKRMGILGELPEAQMFELLQKEMKKWELADSLTPVKPALHYIAVTAQVAPSRGGKYRQRMPDAQIDTIVKMAKKIDALIFLDFQVGQSTLQEELPLLEKYFKLPNVHLGIDPEFSMKEGGRPGRSIGTYAAEDINYATSFLDSIVKKHQLPPKILVVHRFTKDMVTGYDEIEPLPNVQVVIHMDGWGAPATKRANYNRVIHPEPVQFAGFKIFYKNDTRMVNRKTVMQPEDMLQLNPKPIYIQYQ